jgi:hypothetical protein
MKSLREFILEWDLVTARRHAGRPWPWSGSQILQKYRFGNFRRQADRLNRHLIHLFEKRVVDRDPFLETDLVVNRMVSQVSFTTTTSFNGVAGSVGPYKAFDADYMRRRKLGLPVRPNSFMSCKSDQQFLYSIYQCYKKSGSAAGRIMAKPTLRTVYKEYHPLIGPFTAWQLALDFLMLGLVTNEDQFFHLGPGSRFALTICGKPASRVSFLDTFHTINRTPEIMPMTVDELEGALCEYGKYFGYHNTRFPGKFRYYFPLAEPLPPIPLDKQILDFYGDKI